MTLSIITINYNNKDGLKRTFDSVVSQTFTDFEWIVIDGGSTDGSRELIEKYSEYFAFWVSEPDNGIYNAMNKGVKVARGEYLQFLNSGDWLYDETILERCFHPSFTADILYGNILFVKNDGARVRRDYPSVLSLRFLYKSAIGHGASFIKRRLLEECPYDEGYRIVSDWAFFLKQAMNGSVFEHLDLVITCFDTTGISSTNRELLKQERQSVINEMIPKILVQDFQRMDEMEAILNKFHVKKVLEIGEKRKFYHKIITVFLGAIGYIDRLFR